MTPARVALGRVGSGVPTAAHLAFLADHAAARDAVWSVLDVPALLAEAKALGLDAQGIATEAGDRRQYLLRPDLGRRLRSVVTPAEGKVVFVVADGLCALGVQAQAMAVIAACLIPLGRAGFALGAVLVAEQARVGLTDPIGAATGALAVIMLIGERPGLSATDSLGAYLTWQPRPGLSDADRNCISNIRPAGLSAVEAARRIAWLLIEARRRGSSGVALKDGSSAGDDPMLPQETQ